MEQGNSSADYRRNDTAIRRLTLAAIILGPGVSILIVLCNVLYFLLRIINQNISNEELGWWLLAVGISSIIAFVCACISLILVLFGLIRYSRTTKSSEQKRSSVVLLILTLIFDFFPLTAGAIEIALFIGIFSGNW